VALEDTFNSCCSLEGVDVLGVVLRIVGNYPKKFRSMRWYSRVGAVEDQAHLIDQGYSWHTHFAHVLYEPYETMARRGNKPGRVYVPVTGDQSFTDSSRSGSYFAKALHILSDSGFLRGIE
jgi:hypothetical protein